VILPRPGAETAEKVATNVVVFGSALLCAWRAVTVRRERAAWTSLAVALTLWGLGDVYFALALWDLAMIPIPSLADVGYLGLYPGLFAGLLLLYRESAGARKPDTVLWADAAVGGLALAAVAATLVYGPLKGAFSGSPGEIATGLAYPLADLSLLAVTGSVVMLTGRRLRGGWACIAVALGIFAITDALYLYTNAIGTYGDGWWFDAGWPIAALLMASAAWLPSSRATPRDDAAAGTIALPLTLAGICLTLLVIDHFVRVNVLALVLATTALVAVLVRLALTFEQNLRMLQASRREAMTDGLTGLRNRRALIADLHRACARERGPMVLALFDLDGFKLYNDAFGHPAGDALLARLGAALERAVDGRGTAYRFGGDEFCILVDAGGGDVAQLVADAGASLTERGEAFSVGCSYGSALVPDEADSAAEALRVADQRMYAEKQGCRPSALLQSKNVLRQALSERHPDLGPHVSEVAELADAVARRLGLADGHVAEVRLAAELHDVGKVAIPEVIIDKPGPLDDTEWRFMRRHTLIGERIVAAAPALASIARIVRSSHERVDGGGYPDGLVGHEIPLASRIVFACDSFDAMTSDRPYKRAMGEHDAICEMRRCAGEQFDAMVVEALCGVLAERRGHDGPARPLSPRGSAGRAPA
jgi:two-component system cell cycle response regulator